MSLQREDMAEFIQDAAQQSKSYEQNIDEMEELEADSAGTLLLVVCGIVLVMFSLIWIAASHYDANYGKQQTAQ